MRAGGSNIRITVGSVFYALIICIHIGATDLSTISVFKSGEDGYRSYRIPVIVRAKNGDLLAFAEGRKNGPNDHGDIDIVLRRSADGGRSWEALQVIQDEPGDPAANVWIGNPTPVVDDKDQAHPGRLWLVFTRSNTRIFATSSDDNGNTWSDRREITKSAEKPSWGWYAAGPVHGIQLERGPHAGRLIIPCDHRQRDVDSWGSHLIYSDDHGATWKLGASDTRPATDPLHPNECVAVELVDGRVYVNAREHDGSDPATRVVAYSRDGGQTFDAPFAAERNITSPVVQNSLIRFAATDQGDKRNVLVYSGPGHPTKRRDLTILLSYDEAKTWTRKTVIHHGPAAYSDIVKLNGGRIGVLFEGGKKLYDEILFGSFALADLAKR
jgi:sialidase-1